MCSKIPGRSEPQVQASHVLVRTKRKRNEPVGPDYILLDPKRPNSTTVDSLSAELQGTSLTVSSNDRGGEDKALMFVRGGIGAHIEQDQNILSMFCTLPLPIGEDETERTQKRLIGEKCHQRFIEVRRVRAKVTPSTSNSTPPSAITPHHVGSEQMLCVIDAVNMELSGISDSQVIPAEDKFGNKLQNGNPQGDSIQQVAEQQTEDGKGEWVYDIYRPSGLQSIGRQQFLYGSPAFGIIDPEEVGYAGDEEDGELLEPRNELNLIMENDTDWSNLSDEDDKDSNDEDFYRNNYPDGDESNEEPLVHEVDPETDEEWICSDSDDDIHHKYLPYGSTRQQAFWREVEPDLEEEDL